MTPFSLECVLQSSAHSNHLQSGFHKVPLCLRVVIGLSTRYDSWVSAPSITSTIRDGSLLRISIAQPCVMTAEAIRLKDEVARITSSDLTGVTTVYLDLSLVQVMSSRGFEALVVLHRACTDRAIAVKCSRQTEGFRQLMNRMGFAKLFEPSPEPDSSRLGD